MGELEMKNVKEPVKFGERPLVVVAQILVIPMLLALAGFGFSGVQAEIANARQEADSADKARETREKVLSDYSDAISKLITEENLGKQDDSNVANIARGRTLIDLRRLDPGDESGNSGDEPEKGVLNRLNPLNLLKGLNPVKNSTNTEDASREDSGELKGLLIRYLYDAKLIGYDPNAVSPREGDGEFVIDLYGANVTKVALEDAWLPGIDLAKAEYNEGNFRNTNLTNAKLYQANFRSADFTGANLKGAIFTNANLTNANLYEVSNLDPQQITQACYWEKAIYTASEWQEQEQQWVAKDEAANQRAIDELAAKPTESADCKRWEEEEPLP